MEALGAITSLPLAQNPFPEQAADSSPVHCLYHGAASLCFISVYFLALAGSSLFFFLEYNFITSCRYCSGSTWGHFKFLMFPFSFINSSLFYYHALCHKHATPPPRPAPAEQRWAGGRWQDVEDAVRVKREAGSCSWQVGDGGTDGVWLENRSLMEGKMEGARRKWMWWRRWDLQTSVVKWKQINLAANLRGKHFRRFISVVESSDAGTPSLLRGLSGISLRKAFPNSN